ncbi:MAG: carbonic anhydrase [Firmicutes bacterium]|nr:carbonic anhydrase [Bacillota bacterium]
MSRLYEILEHNRRFVASRAYEAYRTTKIPEKKMVVLTCMDTRLIELLPKAMNLKNGDAKVVRNAGALVSHPYGSVMRSILVAIYQLGAREVYVVGHRDCGMTGLRPEAVLERARERGVPAEKIEAVARAGVQLDHWLTGFRSVEEGVAASVRMVREHPLLPPGVPVHGLIIDPETGKLDLLIDGNNPGGEAAGNRV